MKNVLEKGIAIGLLAFGIGIVHADISSKHGGYLPSLKPAEPPVATKVRFLDEPRNSSTVVLVKYKKVGAHKIDLAKGASAGGTNLTAQSDSMQTSGYVGSDRRISRVDKVAIN